MNQFFYVRKHKSSSIQWARLLWLCALGIAATLLSETVPPAFAFTDALSLAPANPHYFVLDGRPTVLVGSTEHYGAVLNGDFDYVRYLNTVQHDHLNLVRIFTGVYRERQAADIIDNSLSTRPQALLTPWLKVTSVSSNGTYRFDLEAWDPAFFLRFRNFMKEAQRRGIVVELSLFCTFYGDEAWKLSPLYPDNNVNGATVTNREDVYTLKNMSMVRIQEKMVEKVVTELNSFDNLYYEIINEPYYAGVTLDWQRYIAHAIHAAETNLPKKHLIAQNIANWSVKVEDPNEIVSIFNFHYSRPPDSVQLNYGLNRAISFDETGFDGTGDATYRVQGWDFLAAGGAIYDHLDFSFTVGHENGTYAYPPTQPGGGGVRLRKQLGFLNKVFSRIPDLLAMKPINDFLPKELPAETSARVLGIEGRYYLLYVHHGRLEGVDPKKQLVIDSREQKLAMQCVVPEGKWRITWLNPGKTKTFGKQNVTSNGSLLLSSPAYHEDIAAIIERRQ